MTPTHTYERPILFTGSMVRAILAGTKTVTRRVVKGVEPGDDGRDCIRDTDGMLSALCWAPENWEVCPYGVPGDRLWVRETFWRMGSGVDPPSINDCVHYRADTDECAGGPWKPSIFMPRWACRVTLKVAETSVEPVRCMSDEDAIAEGVEHWEKYDADESPLDNFVALWDSINAKRGRPWRSNPWVWVVSFCAQEIRRP